MRYTVAAGISASDKIFAVGVLERTSRIAIFVGDRGEGSLMSIAGGKRPAERPRDRLSLLRNHPLFRDLPPTVIEHLGSYMKTRRVARGTSIFAKGDPGTGLMGVLAGTVKVSVASAEGKDVVLNVFHEGEVFGEIALLDGRPRTADATAMSDCELIVIERRDFVPFLSAHSDVMLKFIEILCSRLRRTSEQVQDITFLNLPTRLAKTLLQLTAAEDGSAASRKAAVTQREISQMIGISRESTNKQLRTWAKRGWIRLERGGVTVVAADKLAAVAAEGSEFDAS
jgi:CRP/FNR family cyclic AMP-dependent transcriptional regulator